MAVSVCDAQVRELKEAYRLRDSGEVLDAFTAFTEVLKKSPNSETTADVLVNQIGISVVTINMLQHMINRHRHDLSSMNLSESQTRAMTNKIRQIEDLEVVWAKKLINGYNLYSSEYDKYSKSLESPFIDLNGVQDERRIQIQATLFNQVFGVPKPDNRMNSYAFLYAIANCCESIGHWEGAEDIYETLSQGNVVGVSSFYAESAKIRLKEVKKQNPSFLSSLWSGINRASEMLDWFANDYGVNCRELGGIRGIISEIKKNQEVVQFIAMLVDAESERRIGEQAVRVIESQYKITESDHLLSIGRKLLSGYGGSEYTYSFRIIETDELNAYACPGGFVFVTRGLLRLLEGHEQSDGMIAFVLGHEISHIERRHCFQELKRRMGQRVYTELIGTLKEGKSHAIMGDMSEFVIGLCRYGYSRNDEYEADLLGVALLISAEISSNDALEVLEILSQYEDTGTPVLLRTHPPIEERIRRIRNEL